LTPVFLVYFLAAAKERRKFVWIPMLAFAAVWSIDLLANFSRFGNIFITGYGHVVAKAQGGNRFLKGLYYYWLSCGKGFFFYNLPLVLGLFYWRETREKSKPEFYFVVSIILVYTVFFAYFFKRGSIFSWGPRYMFPVVPLFAVLAAGVFRKRLALYVFAGLALLGFFVQLPAILTHYSSYINFAVEKLGAEEYMLNFIPDLSPIKGAWLILASVANVNFGGQGITFMFNPDPLLVRSVSAPISDYAMSDLWWSNLLKVYPNMNFVVYGTFILLILMFALGAFKLIKSDYSD
jgi:hypothetical protein